MIFAPVALIIGLFFTFKGQIFAVFRRLGCIVATFTPVGAVLRGIFTGAWNLIVGVWERLSGWSGSIWGGKNGVFSVAAAG